MHANSKHFLMAAEPPPDEDAVVAAGMQTFWSKITDPAGAVWWQDGRQSVSILKNKSIASELWANDSQLRTPEFADHRIRSIMKQTDDSVKASNLILFRIFFSKKTLLHTALWTQKIKFQVS